MEANVFEALEEISDDEVDTWRDMGFSSLHVAAVKGRKEVVEQLLNDENVNHVSSLRGFAALHLAAGRGHVEVVNLLLQRGANVNIKTRSNLTSLHIAAYNGYISTVKTLVEHGAEINEIGSNRTLPIHEAAKNGFPDIVRYLVGVGSQINCVDRKGRTPLQYAAINDHHETVQEIVTLGAAIMDNKRNSFLEELYFKRKLSLIKIIFEYKTERSVVLMNNSQLYLLGMLEEKYMNEFINFLIIDANLDTSADIEALERYLSSLRILSTKNYEILKRFLNYDYEGNLLYSGILYSYYGFTIIRHFVRLEVLKQQNWSTPKVYKYVLKEYEDRDDDVESLIDACINEIHMLNQIAIGDSSFTMYSVLSGGLNVAYRCVKGVGMEVIKEINFHDFKMYGEMIECLFYRVIRRVNLINQLKSCEKPEILLKLPCIALEMIISFLSDEDIEMLIKTTCSKVELSSNLVDEFWDPDRIFFNKF